MSYTVNQDILSGAIKEVLSNTPYKPFLCLPLSALLYATLSDTHNFEARLVTGELLFKGEHIFRHDFKISEAKPYTYQEWAGHAWVEIEGNICDISFFRTLYSESFTKDCKSKLIETFGEGRGALIGSSEALACSGLEYRNVEYLSDDLVTGIIKGFDALLNPQ